VNETANERIHAVMSEETTTASAKAEIKDVHALVASALRRQEHEANREPINSARELTLERQKLEGEIKKLQSVPDWEEIPELDLQVNLRQDRIEAIDKDLEAISSENVGIAAFRNAVAVFTSYHKEDGQTVFAFDGVSDVRAYGRAFHDLLSVTESELVSQDEMQSVQNNPDLRKQLMLCRYDRDCRENVYTFTRIQADGSTKTIELKGKEFRFKRYTGSPQLRFTTWMVQSVLRHLQELGAAAAEEMQAHRDAANKSITSIKQIITKDDSPMLGVAVLDVEGDFGRPDNRRTFKGTVALESTSEGVTLRAVAGPLASRLNDYNPETGESTTLVGTFWPRGEKIHPKVWHLRDQGSASTADSDSGQTRMNDSYVSTSEDFEVESPLAKLADLKGSSRRGQSKRTETPKRNPRRRKNQVVDKE